VALLTWKERRNREYKAYLREEVMMSTRQMVSRKVKLRNASGFGIAFIETKTPGKFALGRMTLSSQVPFPPVREGFLWLRGTGADRARLPVALQDMGTPCGEDPSLARNFAAEVDYLGTEVLINLEVRLDPKEPVLRLKYECRTSEDLPAVLEFPFHGPEGEPGWRLHLYPWIEDADRFPSCLDETLREDRADHAADYIARPFDWCGAPLAVLQSDTYGTTVLFGLQKDFDYGHPGTWRDRIGFAFAPGIPPYVRSDFPNGIMRRDLTYDIPLILVVAQGPDNLDRIRSTVRAWARSEGLQFEATGFGEGWKEAVDVLVRGRRRGRVYIEDKGYCLDRDRMESWGPYVTSQPYNYYLDELLYRRTGDGIWARRVESGLRWLASKQNLDGGPCHGAFPPIAPGRGEGIGFYKCREYEVEHNAFAADWLYRLSNLLRDRAPDLSEVALTMARSALHFVLNQILPDGGVPAKVTPKGVRSVAVTPGHTLLLLRRVRSTEGGAEVLEAERKVEAWTRRNSLAKLHFHGAHPDLQPEELEEASLYNVAQYYLERFEETRDAEYLRIAESLACLGLLWQCPKQLSWVDNPTQGAAAEQTHYLQYSVYSYNCEKFTFLIRLSAYTGDRFYREEARHLLGRNLFTLVREGEWEGAVAERICDPWNARGEGYNSFGNLYIGELATELLLQALDLEQMLGSGA